MGGCAAATMARGAACRGTLAALERRVRAVDDDACDMSTRERAGLSRPQASNGQGTTGGRRRRWTGGRGR